MTELRKTQLVMLSMMKEVDELFKKNDIHYMLLGGSVLGAVRHNGFIPWDDDIDVGVLRKDFEKAECLLGALPQYHYEAAEKHSIPQGPFGHLYFFGNGYTFENAPTIDFFSIDAVPNVKNKKLMRPFMFWARMHHLCVYRKIPKNHGVMAKVIIGAALFLIPNFIWDRLQVLSLKKVFENKAQYDWLGNIWQGINEFFPPKIYLELKDHVFEDMCFPIPKDFETYLTSLYGDWRQLPPESERVPKHKKI